MAKIGAVHGLDGDMHLHYFTNSIEDLLQYKKWWIKYPNSSRWISLSSNEEVYRLGIKILIRLSGVTSREKAKAFVNSEIGVLRSDLPSLSDEYYWIDLIGMSVTNHLDKPLGLVVDMIETGANDVLVIKNTTEDKEILIPFVSEYVLEVDKDSGGVKVYWEDDFDL